LSRLPRKVLVGVTGASGAIYAERLIEELLKTVERVYIIATDSAREVAQYELSKSATDRFSLIDALEGKIREQDRSIIRLCRIDDFFSPVASGSSAPTDMIVMPCSMGTLGRIAGGLSTNLLERAADVVLKERKRLVVCPREAPFNSIHLKNMLTLHEAGAIISPPMPAFYQKPKTLEDTVDFVVGKTLETIEIEHSLYPKWNSRMS
jgi:4-hydroxy-3-polyprenylbenzoate decarboxylase